jgi:hypothetical protein
MTAGLTPNNSAPSAERAAALADHFLIGGDNCASESTFNPPRNALAETRVQLSATVASAVAESGRQGRVLSDVGRAIRASLRAVRTPRRCDP